MKLFINFDFFVQLIRVNLQIL